MEIKGTILSRIGWIYVLVLVGALGIVTKVFVLQSTEGDYWRAKGDSLSQRTKMIPANRGNILDTKGNPIASTIPKYDLAIDPNSSGIDPQVFEDELPGLAKGLADIFGDKTAWEYKNSILEAKKLGVQHLNLQKGLSYSEVQKVKELPLFRYGQFKGGMKLTAKSTRVNPYELLAKRTIGYVQEGESGKRIGLEGAYDTQLSGESGMRHEYRLGRNNWMPTSTENFIEPQDGFDIVSTIDMNYQDVAEYALYSLLAEKQADHGCAVLMEVKTGEIKAMVNLTRGEKGQYHEIYNYAVGERHEPGSTFKLPALMAALEAGHVDLDDTVNTFKGKHSFYGSDIYDSRAGGYGIITVQKILEKSSNVGMARIIDDCYKNNPQQFINRLFAMGLKEKTGIEIEGETSPRIKSPKDSDWYKTTLPFMAHGYELEMTPLQILTFYNAVANGGKMVAPRLVKGIKYHSHLEKTFGTRVIKNSICSKETIKKARILLEGVVKNGTATNLESKAYQIAGKTGTAVISQGSSGYLNAQGKKDYRASFVGYFPADDPAYSCIVVVTKPQKQYYGNVVAGTVFQDIADKVYATDIKLHPNLSSYSWSPVSEVPEVMSGDIDASKVVLKSLGISYSSDRKLGGYGKVVRQERKLLLNSLEIEIGKIPDVTGMGISDALPLLENQGLKVLINGHGKIISQSIDPGEKITPGQTIELKLKFS